MEDVLDTGILFIYAQSRIWKLAALQHAARATGRGRISLARLFYYKKPINFLEGWLTVPKACYNINITIRGPFVKPWEGEVRAW